MSLLCKWNMNTNILQVCISSAQIHPVSVNIADVMGHLCETDEVLSNYVYKF